MRRYQQLNNEVKTAGVSMLAVSKYAPDEAVQLLIDAGHRQFGESRPQNLRDRANRWPECEWHMIGPMQKNKAKYIGRYAAMWHSCENLETAKAVARHVTGRSLPVLIQVNIAHAPGQHGVSSDALGIFAEALADMEGLQLAGLMCMAPRDGDARLAFGTVRELWDTLSHTNLAEVGMAGSGSTETGLTEVGKGELSMGMSGDYRIAMQKGSTMVRLGSILFGDWDVRNAFDFKLVR